MKIDLILLAMCFALSTASSIAAAFILNSMVKEINRKKDHASQCSFFGTRWRRIVQEYQAFYPNGTYSKPLTIVSLMTVLFFLAFVYLFFSSLLKDLIPSR